MPKFIDHHSKMPPMTPEVRKVVQQIANDIKAKKADPFGVMPVNVYIGVDGEAWCLTDAPNADAVMKMHEANGMQLSKNDIIEVNSLV